MSGEAREGAALLAMWDDAAAPTIEVCAPTWPQLTEFSGRLWTLFRTLADVEALVPARSFGFRGYRYLTSTPLSPADVVITLEPVIETCHEFVNAWPSHAGAASVRSLAEATEALVVSDSPFAEQLEAVASRYDSAVLLVPAQRLKAPVQSALDRLELNGVEVATKSELRLGTTRRFEAAIVIGDPAWTYASMRVPATLEAQRSGWLLTAPSAPRVIVLLAGGCQSIDNSAWWLLGAGQHPAIHLGDQHGKPITLPPVAHHLATARTSYTLSVGPAPPGVTTTIASPVSFASGRIAFFSEDGPPEPRVLLAADDGGVDIHHVPIQDLRPSSIVLLRVGHSETEELRRRAIERLRTNGWSDAELRQALQAAEHLKILLRELLKIDGRQHVEVRLRAEGLSDGYARVLTRHPLRGDYIAPQKGYDAFVSVLGDPALREQKGLLFGLRHATRQAGHDIRRELEERLCSDISWTDDIDADGFARICAEGLGTIYLEVVIQVHEEHREVAISSLGHLLDPTGEPFLGGGAPS